ncbi:MAG: hypothetical protein EOR91_30405 [Mesorhizobium sp.]|nr:MAG: hypothetical protein EOR91_30405 [Mesorhizobium sp.]
MDETVCCVARPDEAFPRSNCSPGVGPLAGRFRRQRYRNHMFGGGDAAPPEPAAKRAAEDWEGRAGSRRWCERTRDRRRRNAGGSWGGFERGCSGNPRAEATSSSGPTGAIKVMVATKPVDFHKGAEGLAALIGEAIAGSVFGRAYVFRANRADRTKPAYFEGTGMHVRQSAGGW